MGPLNVRRGSKEPSPPSATSDWNQSSGLRNVQNHFNEGPAGNVLHLAKMIHTFYIYIYTRRSDVGRVTGPILNKFHRCFLHALQADVLIVRTNKSRRLQYKS